MKLGSTLFTIGFLIACGGTSTTIGDGGGDGSSTGDGSSGGDGGAMDVATDSPLGDCKAPPIDITFANCPAKPSCGGTIADGNYFYTSGCIQDPWAQAKMACQALSVTNQKGSVKACVTFASGIVTRNVQSQYSATLGIPTPCLLGGTCMQAEQGLKQYFPTVTCKQASSGCDCDVSSTYIGTGGTTYTTANNTLTTGQNNAYAYCAMGGKLDMQWVSGPNQEPGVYTLTKQ